MILERVVEKALKHSLSLILSVPWEIEMKRPSTKREETTPRDKKVVERIPVFRGSSGI